MSKQAKVECPACSEQLVFDLPTNGGSPDPDVRCNMKPRDTIYEYRITTAQILEFCTAKLEYYSPGSRLRILPAPTKVRHPGRQTGVVSIHMAISSDILENESDSFLDRVGNDPNDIKIKQDVYVRLIKSYLFNRRGLIEKLNDPRDMEFLRDRYGINEGYMQWLISNSTPMRMLANDNSEWIMFVAETESILKDMLCGTDEEKFSGKLRIIQVNSIDDDNMEMIIHVSKSTTSSVAVDHNVVQMMRETRK